MKPMPNTVHNVALVYDWVDKWGGVERMIQLLHRIFPRAPLYTAVYQEKTAQWASGIDVRPSFMQRLPSMIRSRRVPSLVMFPHAFESFDLSAFDTIISLSSFAAKGVLTRPDQKHIGIILTPPRYLWSLSDTYIAQPWLRSVSLPLRAHLRRYDYIAAQRPDVLISISETVRARCRTYYGRDSQIVSPPFSYDYWDKIKAEPPAADVRACADRHGPYFLVVSRLEPYKSVDIAIESFRKMNHHRLLVVGKGSQFLRLKKQAPANVVFMGMVDDASLAYLYGHAEGLIMPQEEDFGYVSLEAQVCGCPVIAYGKGGARETVLPDCSGVFFPTQTPEALRDALARFRSFPYNKDAIINALMERKTYYGYRAFEQAIINHIRD
jgi:glycosyltransferase involved in cell wall biosynthesis